MAFDRECCVLYKAVMDELVDPEASAIVMSSAQNDPPEWKVSEREAEQLGFSLTPLEGEVS